MHRLLVSALFACQIVLHVARSSASDCGPEYKYWTLYNGNCYLLNGRIGSAYTWHNANKYCLDRGAQLASVHTEEENVFISKQASGLHPTIWLGLNSLGPDVTYSWTDGSAVNFTRVDLSKADTTRGRCAALSSPGPEKNWLFMHCDTKAAFACKRPQNEEAYTIPPPTRAPQPGNCAEGWSRIGNKCFKVFSSNDGHKVNHSTARDHCLRLGKGQDLASILSEEENLLLTTITTNQETNLWIGLSRITFTDFGWTDNSALDFTKWAPGEPSSVAEGCTEFITTKQRSGMWNDISCRAEMGYICQGYPDLAATTATPPTVKCTEDGFERFGTSCYKVFSGVDQFTWPQAEEFCQGKSGHLASLHNGQEIAYLQRSLLLEDQGPLWIGLQRSGRGVHSWSDGWPVTYLNFKNTLLTNSTLCGLINHNSTWNLADCNQKKGFVCKITDDKRPEYPEMDSRPCPSHVSPILDIGLKYCYSIRNTYLSWGDANLECLKNESTLASIHSQEELELLSPHISQSPIPFWIGQIRKYDRDFKWIDGTRMDFQFWKDKEPSNKTNDDCVMLSSSLLKASATECKSRTSFICKISKG